MISDVKPIIYIYILQVLEFTLYPQETDEFVVQILNAGGDLLDLMKVVGEEKQPDFSQMTHQQLLQYVNHRGHCSALVKVFLRRDIPL